MMRGCEMKRVLAALLALIMGSAHAANCSPDHAKVMASDFRTFSEGLRSLDQKACAPQIRDLLHEYREARKKDLTAGQYRLLTWQEGTMRAKMGDNFTAIPLLSAWLDDPTPAIRDYAAATIAFLNRDKPALLAARDRLIAEPKPDGFDEQAFHQKWPLNLVIVDAFVGCYDRPYAEVYDSEECTALGEKAR
jgi:hypothetical protein